MGTGTLAIRTVSLSRWMRYLLWAGIAALPVGIGIAIFKDVTLGAVIGGLGVLIVAYLYVTCLRHPVFTFDVTNRTVTRVDGSGRTKIGEFKDFTGVDIVGRVNEKTLEGTSLHEIHKTYPSASLMRYDVCLVGPGDPVKIVCYDDKKSAVAAQKKIVEHCGWTHLSTSIPDAKRLLQ